MRDVPRLHIGLDGDIHRTLGHQAVGPEIPVSADPPHGVGEFDEIVIAASPQPVRSENDRLAEPRSSTPDPKCAAARRRRT